MINTLLTEIKIYQIIINPLIIMNEFKRKNGLNSKG